MAIEKAPSAHAAPSDTPRHTSSVQTTGFDSRGSFKSRRMEFPSSARLFCKPIREPP